MSAGRQSEAPACREVHLRWRRLHTTDQGIVVLSEMGAPLEFLHQPGEQLQRTDSWSAPS